MKTTGENKGVSSTLNDISEELRRLMRIPVGRRMVLKLGGLAVLGMATAQFGGCSDDGGGSSGGSERPREVHDLYFTQGTSAMGNLTLHAGGKLYSLETMTDLDRAELASQGGLYGKMDTSRLSHVARNVDLPGDRPLALFVTGPTDSGEGYFYETIHVPMDSAVTAWKAALQLAGSVSELVGDCNWLEELGISSPNELSAEDLAQLNVTVSPSLIAASLVYKHPEISSLEKDSSAVTMTLLLSDPGVSDLGALIAQMIEQGEPYATEVPVLDGDGNPVYITNPTTGDKIQAFTMEISTDLTDRFGRAVRLCVNDVKDCMDLEGKTWNLTPGTPPEPRSTDAEDATESDDYQVVIQWTGYRHGAKVTHGDFDPSTRQIPIKIYNNYVRYLGVFVQYLDGQGERIPPSGTSKRNTDYSQWVVDVQDMPTIYGVPFMQDHNYSEATLTLPSNASAARILMCGLGKSPHGTDWRDFFPSDAYPHRINPDECIMPIVMTSVFDIGITLMFLALDVSTTTFLNCVRKTLAKWETECVPYLADIKDAFAAIRKTTTLAVTALVAGGAATTTDLMKSGGSLTGSIWGDLLQLGKVIPRLISLCGSMQKLLVTIIPLMDSTKAIPIIGEIMAAMAVAGDTARLVETSAEVATSPWVIKNALHVTYTATVTIHHDPDDVVFPRTATNWQLTPVIGGSGSRNPITGDVTPVGTRSEPIVVTITDVPISGTIQYQVSFTNAQGAQVGNGASDKLANNDVSNLPRDVTFTIKEIPVAITASTRFQRQNTTAYDTADDGYTWTEETDIGGTVQDKPGLLEINGITVGTVSGMAGYIWRADSGDDPYWIRNLPTVQNENQKTIKLQTAGPYSRKPLIVYDRLNPDLVDGNNFLLEPDDEGTGYQVRRLELSADGGTLGWDTGMSWGQFLNPLSAVTQHPSGYLIGVNAQTGKLDIHKLPKSATADTGLVPLCSSYAGPGTRPGLTQTPVGIAITVTGMIAVLEAGANRLQCLDLNGNPVKYFGADSDRAYYADLAGGEDDTLLSLAVDGQGWFYVLSYTGQGSQVSDYAVDVYDAKGDHVVRSPGMNVATFDVDYWRNVFALNYAALADTDGTPHVDPATGVVEPSSSIFVPKN